MKLPKKPEPTTLQGLCVLCNVNLQMARSKNNFRSICYTCHIKRHNLSRSVVKYRQSKKDHCEQCGFIPVHPCQLDVDHVDGDHTNDDPANLQTLCANCHRLKTYLNQDWTSNDN